MRPVDVQESEWQSALEAPTYQSEIAAKQPAIRLGFQRIKGFKADSADRIIHARNHHPIQSIKDIAKRARLDKGDLAKLTEGGAFKSLSGHRYQTHWQVSGLLPPSPLFDEALNVAEPNEKYALQKYQEETTVVLPPPLETDDLRADYTSLGLTLGRHPMALLREKPNAPFRKCKTAAELQTLNHGRFVQVSGIVTGRQRPSTASGVLFLTLEDETDNINVVVWARIIETYRAAVVQGRLLKIKGVMERQASVIHVIAGHVEDLSEYLEHFSLKSRDFR